MNTDYRKELEKITRQMILVRRADLLIKLVLRTIVQQVHVRHAGIFIYDRQKDAYVMRSAGFKVPSGFVKFKNDNPIIQYFINPKPYLQDGPIIADKVDTFSRSAAIKNDAKAKKYMEDLTTQLSFYQAKVCVPGFFRKDLVLILFLGDKNNGDKFSASDLGFLSVLASDIAMALENAWLFEDLSRQVGVNKRLFLQMITALVSSIEAKDKCTRGHTDRVMRYALAIAQYLKKQPDIDKTKFNDELKVSALLHDVGKIGIPENILNKPGALTAEEFEVIRRHPLIGEDILKNIDDLDTVRMGVKYHHERCDGKGYPYGLHGEDIPLIASIICLADAYDAMTSDRPYRKALTHDQAVREIKDNKGKQFSFVVVDAFLDFINSDQYKHDQP
jgi:HD-GYP domain-containing protein (c-di-GMP phosphodiesterase class II)